MAFKILGGGQEPLLIPNYDHFWRDTTDGGGAVTWMVEAHGFLSFVELCCTSIVIVNGLNPGVSVVCLV